MTKKQIETLKMLGYKETDEDGAILEHGKFSYWSYIARPHLDYVWKDDKFEYVMKNYTSWVRRCTAKEAAGEVMRNIN